jgi:hypothetical protein
MSLSIYKPNVKSTGCGFSFQCGRDAKSGNISLYVKAIQQHSWDSSKKQGYFQQNVGNPEKNITLKFNEYEVGELIAALSSRRSYSTFHSFGEDKTSIKLVPWDKPKKDSDETSPCFGLSLTRNGNQSFKISLEPGECEALKEFFRFTLHKLYEGKFQTQYKPAQVEQSDAAPF